MSGNLPDLADLGEFRDGAFYLREDFTLPTGTVVRAIQLPDDIPVGYTPEVIVAAFLESCGNSADTGITMDGKPLYLTSISLEPAPESEEVSSHARRNG